MSIPDFVLRLREKVGHDLLWLPADLDHTFRCRYVAREPHVADDESVRLR